MSQYKPVNITNVEIKNLSSYETKQMDRALKNKECEYKWSHASGTLTNKSKILAYHENNKICRTSDNGFLQAFMMAYNMHRDVVLNPDDVWTIIMLQFSKYINKNAEAMRSMFVEHDGQKELAMTSNKEYSENDWTEFFEEIMKMIKNNAKSVELLESSFSTTGFVETFVSTAAVMDSFKEYFTYGRMIPMCGIRNALFMGTLDDWTLLRSKLMTLGQYDVDGKWRKYTDDLVPILEKFIDTFNGDVDNEFWSHIMDEVTGPAGSGSITEISGWILKFYGLTGRFTYDEINDGFFNVPVKIDNKQTSEKKIVNIIGGFGGTSIVIDEEFIAYRPQMSFIVYHDGKLLE
jgi:hypothetical protein